MKIKNCVICGQEFRALGFRKTCSGVCSIARRKAREATPQWKEYQREYAKHYNQTPKAKAKVKLRNASPEWKAYAKRYQQLHRQIPEVKARRIEYWKHYSLTPQYKDRIKRRSESHKYKAYQKKAQLMRRKISPRCQSIFLALRMGGEFNKSKP